MNCEITEAENECLRKVHNELLDQLKLLANAVHGIRIGPMKNGISKLILETNRSVEMIQKYDPDFELSLNLEEDTN